VLDSEELISAYVLDGRGGGRALTGDQVLSWRAEDGPLWVHLDREGEGARDWLETRSGLEAWVTDALLAEETRPRVIASGDALLIILRGVNLNPESDPDDMVSLRILVERDRIISTRKRRVTAAADIRDALARGEGPIDVADWVVAIVDRLVARMGPVIGSIEDEADGLEENALAQQTYDMRTKLATLRRKAIALRRYIAPQREAMSHLQNAQVSWLREPHRIRIREVNDRITRYVEDLDAARERAAVTQEELAGRLAEQMNGTMYRLAIVATVFLPLGLLTGLLGINVGGIPGSEYPWAFTIVSVGLIAVAVGEVLYFRSRRLL
jgi:zinc transporter